MQNWIEIYSDGIPYMIDQSKVSTVTAVQTKTHIPGWVSRLFGEKPYIWYRVAFRIDGQFEYFECDLKEQAEYQQLLLLGVKNGKAPYDETKSKQASD